MALLASLNIAFRTGRVTGPSRDGSIPIMHFHHKVSSERNPVSGKIVGSRHGVFLIRKRVDLTTPIFHEAFTLRKDDNKFSIFELMVRELAPNVGERNYLLIELQGAEVVSIETTMPDYNEQETKFVHEYEDIKLVYEKIFWISKAGGGRVDQLKGEFAVDWLWEAARVEAAKLIAETVGGKDDKDDDKKDDKKDDAKDDKKP